MGRPFADFDTGALAPDLIPDDAFLVASVAWTYGRNPVPPARATIGLYQVDHLRELCRPRCTCGWTTEGPTLVPREAVDRLTLHADRLCSCRFGVAGGCSCGGDLLAAVVTAHARTAHAAVDLVVRSH